MNFRFSDSSALSDGNYSVSAKELLTNAKALAARLQEAKLSRIGLLAGNSLGWVTVDLACLIGDVCLVPIPTFFSKKQRDHVVDTCALQAVAIDSDSVFSGVRIDSLVGTVAGIDFFLQQEKTEAIDVLQLPVGTGKITFTSGSTGTPKGVCLSHAQLLRQAQTLADMVAIESPRHLCVLPLSTLLENVAGLYAPLLVGGEVIVPAQESLGFRGSVLADPQKLLHSISSVEPHSMILIPQLLQFLVGAASQGWKVPSSLRFVAVGGSKVSKKLMQAAHQAGIPAFEGYGLSECVSVVSLNAVAAHLTGSCGRPLPGLEVTLEQGEIIVMGNAMLGYVNEPASWYPDRIATGDLGCCDDAGFLHIEGRKKNLLISSYGRNISPEWVESELLANPMFAEVILLGDAKPYCVALIWLREDNSIGVTETNSRINDWIRKVNVGLPDYAQIQAWHRLSEPLQQNPTLMTDNGRPRREAIAQKFAKEVEDLYAQETN
ncbi:AMP-binding protein [Gammaproteobacteria bacterium]|nr:AMP-binding protein [Gammaproteobacteria bacterium]